MRASAAALLLLCLAAKLSGQAATEGPTNKKAQKAYQQALDQLQQRNARLAIWYFREADKQDGGKCLPCQGQLIQTGLANRDWKAVQDGASELALQVQDPKQQAIAHHFLGLALMNQGQDQHQNDLLARAHDEFTKAIALNPQFADPLFDDGQTLADLHRDDESKAQFEKFVAMTPEGKLRRWRAVKFTHKPELARANLAPEFGIFTADGERVTLEQEAGKVVLIYFWATSCDVCQRGLPHLQEIAKKFQNQPFVIMSISADYDEAAWRSFLKKNDVPGLQYRDGPNGVVSQAFGLRVEFQSNVDHPVSGVWQSSYGLKQDLPKTFTIDGEGVMQAEKLSDSSLDMRLQELITRAGGQAAGK
jgi:thiol-disulfide isomerase/thioredoxin